MALAGYAFLFGILALSGVVDIYYEYSFTVITRPVDLVPVPIVVSLLQAVLLVALLVGVSYYLIKPSWKDIKPYILALGKEKSLALKPTPPSHDENEESEPSKTHIPQTSDSNSSLSPLEAREQEILIGLVSLVLASFLGIKIYSVYFASAPYDLGYLIRLHPLPLKLPILVVILIGFGLLASTIYLLKEALQEFRWLEQTQLIYQLNQHNEQDN